MTTSLRTTTPTIGELAQHSGVSQHTLRCYEKAEMLASAIRASRPPLMVHVDGALNVGCCRDEIVELMKHKSALTHLTL